MKSTAIAPASIGLIKYWGRKDEELRLPENGSIAINLDNLLTTTTVEFGDFPADNITIDGEKDEGDNKRVIAHLDRIRTLANIHQKAKVVSKNSFPSKTGLSSSSSGLGALTVAGCAAAGLHLSAKDLSILARQASGSACRSIPDGFVQWLDGDTSDTSYATTIFPPDHWAIADVVAVVSTSKKEVSTSKGHATTQANPFMAVRIGRMKEKNERMKKIIADKNFAAFGALIEEESLELHAMMFTSDLFYLQPGTVEIMRLCKYKWRAEGLGVYFSINTGQDIHLFCEEKNIDALLEKLRDVPFVRQTIINRPGKGAHLTDQHLF